MKIKSLNSYYKKPVCSASPSTALFVNVVDQSTFAEAELVWPHGPVII